MLEASPACLSGLFLVLKSGVLNRKTPFAILASAGLPRLHRGARGYTRPPGTTRTQTRLIGIFWPTCSPIAGVYWRSSSPNVIWQLFQCHTETSPNMGSYRPFCMAEKAGLRRSGRFSVGALRRMEGVTGVSRVTPAVPDRPNDPDCYQ